jgi:N-acetylglucosaminyldiphosphoundecaprenol N-acetyl-beta-D-mannosaminyltransferase
MTSEEQAVVWPPKYDLFGAQISATNYDEAVDAILRAAHRRVPAVVSAHAVHALVTAADDPVLLEKVNAFQLVVPDGQPVRWAMNLMHRTNLRERVYGPELMLRLCARAAAEGVPVYLYGGTPHVVERLCENLTARYPGLRVAGAQSPPFHKLSADEDEQTVRQINESGAGIVFVGLGCPKQDHFAHDHREQIQAVQVCVGAAFDFHAGVKKMAPRWMQRSGLEWLFRLGQEPRRLWRRYLVTNSVFLGKVALALLRRRRASPPSVRSARRSNGTPSPRS